MFEKLPGTKATNLSLRTTLVPLRAAPAPRVNPLNGRFQKKQTKQKHVISTDDVSPNGYSVSADTNSRRGSIESREVAG